MHPLLAARINNQFTETNDHQPLRVHGSANTDAQLGFSQLCSPRDADGDGELLPGENYVPPRLQFPLFSKVSTLAGLLGSVMHVSAFPRLPPCFPARPWAPSGCVCTALWVEEHQSQEEL